jgi:hypothetical protein
VAKVCISIILHIFISNFFFYLFLASAVMVARQEEGARGRGGSPAYSEMEWLNLLGIIGQIIPVSGEEWDSVEVQHCISYSVRKDDLWH